MSFRKVRICALVVGLLLTGSMASASIVSTLDSVSGPVAGLFDFTYSVHFSDALNKIESTGLHPDLFAVLDIIGLDHAKFTPDAGVASGTWTVSYPAQTVTYNNGTPIIAGDDKIGIRNVQVTLTAGGPFVAPIALGTLDIFSDSGQTKLGTCVGSYERLDNLEQQNINATLVPIPAPAAMWAGMGLLGLLGALRARKMFVA